MAQPQHLALGNQHFTLVAGLLAVFRKCLLHARVEMMCRVQAREIVVGPHGTTELLKQTVERDRLGLQVDEFAHPARNDPAGGGVMGIFDGRDREFDVELRQVGVRGRNLTIRGIERTQGFGQIVGGEQGVVAGSREQGDHPLGTLGQRTVCDPKRFEAARLIKFENRLAMARVNPDHRVAAIGQRVPHRGGQQLIGPVVLEVLADQRLKLVWPVNRRHIGLLNNFPDRFCALSLAKRSEESVVASAVVALIAVAVPGAEEPEKVIKSPCLHRLRHGDRCRQDETHTQCCTKPKTHERPPLPIPFG